MPTNLSIIIPLYNDLPALIRLYSYIRQLDPAPTEIIVVGCQNDTKTKQFCQLQKIIYIESDKGRGIQLNSGASHATGDIFWFLHADSTPPFQSISLIEKALQGGKEAGFFKFSFTQKSLSLNSIAFLTNLRTKLGGVAYGDQGHFFLKDSFIEQNGFAPTPLFEEVKLMRVFQKRKSLIALTEPIGVNPRKWQREGALFRSLHNRLLAIAFTLKVSPKRLADWYYAKKS